MVTLLDLTLRAGTGRGGVRFSLDGKRATLLALDALGVPYIEVWGPANDPDTTQLLREIDEGTLTLSHSQLVVHGRVPTSGEVETDPVVRGLVGSGARVATISSPADPIRYHDEPELDHDGLLRRLAATIAAVRGAGMKVIVNCEHAFDDYARDPESILAFAEVVADQGAEVLVLCDTNGGVLPSDVTHVISTLRPQVDTPLGAQIKTDAGCAVANTLLAVTAGADHVQCAVNGYGERVGSADTIAVVGGLEGRMGVRVLRDGGLRRLTATARAVAQHAGQAPNAYQPYVGRSSFAAPPGVGGDRVDLTPDLFFHISPERVGNLAVISD